MILNALKVNFGKGYSYIWTVTIEPKTKFLLVVLPPVAVGHLISWVLCTENGCVTDTEIQNPYLNHTWFLCWTRNRFIGNMVFIGSIEMLSRRDLWRFYSKVTVKVGSNQVRSATAFFSQVMNFPSSGYFTNCLGNLNLSCGCYPFCITWYYRVPHLSPLKLLYIYV